MKKRNSQTVGEVLRDIGVGAAGLPKLASMSHFYICHLFGRQMFFYLRSSIFLDIRVK